MTCRQLAPGLCQRGIRSQRLRQPSEPIFNVPAVVSALLAVLFVIHAVREWALTPEFDNELLWLFAFVPSRYEDSLLRLGVYPGGVAAAVWTLVTYAFLHG